jgi:phage baseplate assembly protein W
MEFYIKAIGDPNFDPSKLQSESQIAQLITQIETVLFTEKGMVMGNYNFGCNLNEMVYEFSYNDFQIKEEIEYQIELHCPLATVFNTDVQVEFAKGIERDGVFINVIIDSQYQLQVVL